MALAEEPPVRVRTGSIEIEIDEAPTPVKWDYEMPFQWDRKGEKSERQGPIWVVVDNQNIEVGTMVRILTNHGAVFVGYSGNRTRVHSTASFRRTRDRVLRFDSPDGKKTVVEEIAVHGAARHEEEGFRVVWTRPVGAP